MCKIRIVCEKNLNLTTERVADIVAQHFGGLKIIKYGRRKDVLSVMRNMLIAVRIDVRLTETSTIIYAAGDFSTFSLYCLFYFLCFFTGVGCIIFIVYGIIQYNFEKEVVDFIMKYPEFRYKSKSFI